MSDSEYWKPVLGYEDAYEVSDTGNVRSLTRVEKMPPHPRTGKPWCRTRHGMPLRLLLGGPEGKKYFQVSLTGHAQRKVHLLVLEAFIGPRPPGMHGCHNNGDKLDNRLTNLRWDTPGANNRDKREHGTNHQVNKTHCPRGHEYSADNVYDPTMTARRCKVCARERARTQAAPANPRTHCRNGHELTVANTISDGAARKCRQCENARQRARYAKRVGKS